MDTLYIFPLLAIWSGFGYSTANISCRNGGEKIILFHRGFVSSMTTSSIWPGFNVWNSRLTTTGQHGCWVARNNDMNQYIQVTFKNLMTIKGVVTKGRPDYPQWVKLYMVLWSPDCVQFHYADNKKIFPGNSDQNSKVTNKFKKAVQAKCVRLVPTSWHGHISLRFDVLGCNAPKGYKEKRRCHGYPMFNSLSKMTASTQWSNSLSAAHGLLKSGTCWAAKNNDNLQYLQMQFKNAQKIRGVITQGRKDYAQWVKSYRILSSVDCVLFDDVNNGLVFTGNSDQHTTISHYFKKVVIAKCFRIIPVTWHGHMSMRFGVIGCRLPNGYKEKRRCHGYQMFNSLSKMTASTQFSKELSASLGLLNSGTCWAAKNNDNLQYLQMQFKNAQKIRGVITQGRKDYAQWVKSYRILSSVDCVLFDDVNNGHVFTGNSDQHTTVYHYFKKVVIAKCFRIIPVTWHGHISMRFGVIGCPLPNGYKEKRRCHGYQMFNSLSKMTASTQFSKELSASLGLLNSGTCWAAKNNDNLQYLQMQFKNAQKIRGVITQGRKDYAQWVKSYRILSSVDCVLFDDVNNGHVFTGNSDQHTTVYHYFKKVVIARCFRIIPVTWHGHISMRFGVIGCPLPNGYKEKRRCHGYQMFNSLSKMTASTQFSKELSASLGLLNSGTCWAAKNNDNLQYLQMQFKNAQKIRGVITQGRKDYAQWVKSYRILSSVDCVLFDDVNNGHVFTGNSDQHTTVYHYFKKVVIARCFRIIPVTWHGHISMRFGVIGCPLPNGYKEKRRCHGYPMFNSLSKMTASTQFSKELSAAQGVLNSGTSWAAKNNDNLQYLQMQFKNAQKIRGVITQGRNDYAQWVRSYRILSSVDCVLFDDVDNGHVFTGNSDQHTPMSQYFKKVVIAKCFRIIPVTWYGHISMRFGVIGCPLPNGYADKRRCHGYPMFNSLSKMTTSSQWSNSLSAALGVLDSSTCWAAKTNDKQQYLQMQFKRTQRLRGVITKGRNDYPQWVTSYKILWSVDCRKFHDVGNGHVLTGNSDQHTPKPHYFERDVIAKCIRIIPVSWYGHISMRFGVIGCTSQSDNISCRNGGEKIILFHRGAVSSMTTSGTWPEFNVWNSRLTTTGQHGCWAARYNNKNQYIQVQFKNSMTIKGVVTRGRPDYPQWVTSYMVLWSPDCVQFHYADNKMIFQGNSDKNSKVTNKFSKAVQAKCVRLVPMSWHGHISLRFDVLGCNAPKGYTEKRHCHGYPMFNSLSKMKASTEWSISLSAAHGVLNSGTSWAAKSNDNQQYLQMQFKNTQIINGVITQGRKDCGQWVKSYKVLWSEDCVIFYDVDQGHVLTGNSDQHTPISNYFQNDVVARCIRIIPVSWHGHISMKFGVIGCRFYNDPCNTYLMSKSNKAHYHITASSQFNKECRPTMSLLNNRADAGSWCSRNLDEKQYIQETTANFEWDETRYPERVGRQKEYITTLYRDREISPECQRFAIHDEASMLQIFGKKVTFRKPQSVNGVITLGRFFTDQWVTSYRVSWSVDCAHFTNLTCQYPLDDKSVCHGNVDRHTPVVNYFEKSVKAKCFRISPVAWHGHISMRFDFIGCS